MTRHAMATAGAVSLAILGSSVAGTFYVAPTGNDDAPGTLEQPWKTIGKANSALRPGDTVYLRGGEYRDQTIEPENSGTSESARIVYAAYPGEMPIVTAGVRLDKWLKCGPFDKVARPDPTEWRYDNKHIGKGIKTFPKGHVRGGYRAIDGVDAVYKHLNTHVFKMIVEDDFATNGRETAWWKKGEPNRQTRGGELFEIVDQGEYFHWGDTLYARTTKADDPNNHKVVGIPEGSHGIKLDGKHYITIRGIHVLYNKFGFTIRHCNHATLEDCTIMYFQRYGSVYECTYTIIRNCRIEGASSFDGHKGDALNIAGGHHHLVENNEIAWAGHSNMSLSMASHSVVRNNLVRDGASLFRMQGGRGGSGRFNVVENNRFARAAAAWDLVKEHKADHPGFSTMGQDCIVRGNRFWGGPGLILLTKKTRNEKSAPTTNYRIYHNTLYKTEGATCPGISLNAGRLDPKLITKNLFVNNISINHVYRPKWESNGPAMESGFLCYGGAVVHDNAIGDNILGKPGPCDALGKARIEANNKIGIDPKITRFDENEPDFTPADDSPAIDAGVFLTKTTYGGDGTRMPVEDPHCFFDGHGIVEGDVIQLEGQTETARITKVDYERRALTLDKRLRWQPGTGVALPYNGKAPDIGAVESKAALQTGKRGT